jgi:hypothetical protein
MGEKELTNLKEAVQCNKHTLHRQVIRVNEVKCPDQKRLTLTRNIPISTFFEAAYEAAATDFSLSYLDKLKIPIALSSSTDVIYEPTSQKRHIRWTSDI